MLTWIFNYFTWPSLKKLALVPLAGVAAVTFWWLCRFAEWFPIPGVAEPTRSTHLWAVYSVFFFAYLVEVIGTTSRASPDWFRVPMTEAARGVAYPFSILAARLFLPLATCGFFDSETGIWAGPIATFLYRNYFAPTAMFNRGGFIRGARRMDEPFKATPRGAAGSPTLHSHPTQVSTFRWIGLDLPLELAEGHLTVIGTPGAGKSLLMRELMASVLPNITPGADLRALIYDVKGDALSLLHQLRIPDSQIITLNPFDLRSTAWSIAEDVDSPDRADRLASALVPERPEDPQKFFANAARAVLRQTILSLMRSAPGRWTLRDLLHITASPKRLRAILSRTPGGRDVLEQFSKPPKTFRNFVQELGAALRPYEAVAAAWEHTDRSMAFTRWVTDGKSIVVLDGRPENRDSLVPLNRVLIKFLSSLLTSGPESPDRARLWVFVDELQEASHLDGLPSILNLGRSKGIRVAMGFQDLEGLEKHWGRSEAEKLASMASNLSVLKLTSPATAEWAARRFGKFECIDHLITWGTTTSVAQHFALKDSVLPAEMLHLDDPKRGEIGIRVSGFHLLKQVQGILAHTAELPIYPSIPGIDNQPRPKEQKYISPWNADDASRLERPRKRRRGGVGSRGSYLTADEQIDPPPTRSERMASNSNKYGVESPEEAADTRDSESDTDTQESGFKPEELDDLVNFKAPD